MNLRAFRTRIVVGAVITALLTLVVVFSTVSTAVEATAPGDSLMVAPAVVAACRADPQAWSRVEFGHDLFIQTWDAQGGSAGGHGALDGAALAQLDAVGAVTRQRDEARMVRVERVAQTGPCALVGFSFGPPQGLILKLRVFGALGATLAVAVVLAFTYRVTITPLLRRISRIREAALSVGAEAYVSSDDRVADALAQIAGVLDASHARIVADRAELVARHEALERYLAEIAHDLRTPIGSLMLGLQEVRATTAEPEALQAASRAIADASYVGALIENLHQGARLRHGLDVREGTADLRDVLSRLEVRFRALAEVQGVGLAASVPDGPVLVTCTPTLAERAIANLLQNAVTHGAKNTAAILSCDENRFNLNILDDGPGLPDALLADLSKRTFRDDAARGRGPGLGLAITNAVAAAAGWTIRYEPGEEGGLTVRIEGPLAGPAGGERA